MYQSILITGGHGMLAQALKRSLDAREMSYAAFDHDECDLTDGSAVEALFARVRPTLVFNCAAHTNVDRCETEQQSADAVNGHAVGTLARLARESHAALVHFSTDFVFDGRSSRPYRPEDPPNPLSAYGRSKLLGERRLQREAPARWMIVRTAWLFGLGGACFPRTIVERARAGQALKVVNDQVGSPTFANDLAEATLELVKCVWGYGKRCQDDFCEAPSGPVTENHPDTFTLRRPTNGIWHATNSGEVSWYDFARAILEEFGVSGDLTPVDTAEWLRIRPQQAPRPRYSALNNEAFAATVGRGMRPWPEALKDYRRQLPVASC